GPNHVWLNVDEGDKPFLNRNGTFLVLAGQLLQDSDIVAMLEKIKFLEQRFAELCVVGFHAGSSVGLVADQARLVDLIAKEYITFPILLCDKNFSEMEHGACYVLFGDSADPLIYHEKDLDLGILSTAIEELHVRQKQNSDDSNSCLECLKGTWSKQSDTLKEPHAASYLQNLLLHFPGCVSADVCGSRLFFSDSNHHRIIISDENGQILDCIGGSPGFEDGDFESAKLLRPGASFYDDAEDYLYFVDSENHAVRKADLEGRVLETVYPPPIVSIEKDSLWSRIISKFGFGRTTESKSEEFDSKSLLFPWHILKSEEDHCLIINRSFETLWVMDLASGEIKDVIKGFRKIMDTFGNLIMDKLSLLKELPSDWLERQTDAYWSSKEIPYATLISSLSTCNDHVFVCDTNSQKVLKLNRNSRACSMFQFRNVGILGLPYWCAFPLEKVYSVSQSHEAWTDHLQHFNQLPGRTDIEIKVDIPTDVELVEPLHEGCIWRQARGTATEVSETKTEIDSSEKAGVAQKWYDELDNLAFASPVPETSVEDEDDGTSAADETYKDGKIHIRCAVNTSPGLSEVIVYAPLYLRLRRDAVVDLEEDGQEKYAARVADILKWERSSDSGRDSCIQLLLRSGTDIRDLVFVKPLHVRIRIECPNHPKAPDNTKDIILTKSAIDVNVSL
ncbi:Protein SUPPRESSOR OF QUENCHING 1, chloroplastic, partial [Linum perenne]